MFENADLCDFAPFNHRNQGSLMTLAKQGTKQPDTDTDCAGLWAVGSVYAKAQSMVESDDHATVMAIQRKINNGSPATVEQIVRSLLKFIVPLAKSVNGNFVLQAAIRNCSLVTFNDLFAAMTGNFGDIGESDYGFYVISTVLNRANSRQRLQVMQELREDCPGKSERIWYRVAR